MRSPPKQAAQLLNFRFICVHAVKLQGAQQKRSEQTAEKCAADKAQNAAHIISIPSCASSAEVMFTYSPMIFRASP